MEKRTKLIQNKINISVAIATYNGEKYIIKQLKTILSQTLPADEVIIIDDCSTDNTVNLITSFIKKYSLNWKIIVNSVNLGYKKNFYKAINNAHGEYIFLSDQDDEWDSRKIELMIGHMKNNKIQALNSGVNIIDENSNEIEIKTKKNYYNSNFIFADFEVKKLSSFDFQYIIKHNISPGCSMAFTKEIKNIFIKLYDFSLPHDWFINLIASVNNSCYYLDEVLTHYRLHGNNVIGSNTNAVKGILTRNRYFRLNEYLTLLNVINLFKNKFDLSEDLEKISTFYKQMLSFYENPSFCKLYSIRENDLYYEITKSKVRLWDFFIAFHLDGLLCSIVKFVCNER